MFSFSRGDFIFSAGEEARAIYFIVDGEVVLSEPRPEAACTGYGLSLATPSHFAPPRPFAASVDCNVGGAPRVRLVRYANGGIFGELDFFLHNRRSFDAEAASDETCLLELQREQLIRMQADAPQLAAALEHALLKYLCFQVTSARLSTDRLIRPRVHK